MTRFLSVVFILTAAISGVAEANPFECTPEAAWRKVRETHPLHYQAISACRDDNSGKEVVVLTEPAPHLTRAKYAEIVKAMFESKITDVRVMRQPLGVDGWIDDLVIEIDPKGKANASISNDLSLLALLNFGSLYKVDIEDIASMKNAPVWHAPPALAVTPQEMWSWLLGGNAQKLLRADGGPALTLSERAAAREMGVYFAESADLVIALLPSGEANPLNTYVEQLRRFLVDTDVFLGAIRFGTDRVALVGRERSTSLEEFPPLRMETVLLLAAHKGSQLSQSYERRRIFSGKLFTEANEYFGWDWAPILLSDGIIDTEFGSLLNQTDQMLKGWSESGEVQYARFLHPYPDHYPFGTEGAIANIQTKQLTYNWNTAGVGLVSHLNGFDIFSIRNTGSLPVSYFPEGMVSDADQKAKLVEAEDKAYKYFSSLRNPFLQRAVQYSALYQVFQAFQVTATPPHGNAPENARMSTVEETLKAKVLTALQTLSSADTPSTKEIVYEFLYPKYREAASEVISVLDLSNDPEAQQLRAKLATAVKTTRTEIAKKIAMLDLQQPSWRVRFAEYLANGYPLPDGLEEELGLIRDGLILAMPREQIRRAIVSRAERAPDAWVRTPSVVVSQGRHIVGGHNISGRATQIVIDNSLPKGSVQATGTYAEGRVLRISPADEGVAQDIVRAFDREAGPLDENLPVAIRAVESDLQKGAFSLRPARTPTIALEQPVPTSARVTRGASSRTGIVNVSYRPQQLDVVFRSKLGALANERGSEIVLARSDNGFVVLRMRPAPPETLLAPNRIAMLDALDHQVKIAALGPPPVSTPTILMDSSLGAERPQFIIDNLHNRSTAVTQAGGKPPFGGDRPPLQIADFPDPGRRFGEGEVPKPQPPSRISWWRKKVDKWTGKEDIELRLLSKDTENLLQARADWSHAHVTFDEPDNLILFDAPHYEGTEVHYAEIRVPVKFTAKPENMIIRCWSYFKESLLPAKKLEINNEIRSLVAEFKDETAEAIVKRYKAKMTKTFGGKVLFQIKQEAADIFVTEVPLTEANGRG